MEKFSNNSNNNDYQNFISKLISILQSINWN